MTPPGIVCCGEPMLELVRGGTGWVLGHGGDTLNTAIHLARAGQRVAYLTALGRDPFSDELRAALADEGLDTSLVLGHPTRMPGLYAVTVDDEGERTFSYWREASAARALFETPGIDVAEASAGKAGLLLFSLISLAILPANGRARLLALAGAVRENGGQVVFDGNYRPRLWTSAEEAQAAHAAAIACADLGLPTFEDEQALWGAAAPGEVAARWRALGCGEVVVKLGADGCLLPSGEVAAPSARLRPVDTSGAGDAFNAGYLDARLRGAAPAQAAAAGHRLAGWTIMRRGAIPRRDAAG